MKNWLKVRFITGFFVTVPAIATAWVLWVFWSWIDDRFAPIYSRMLGRPVSGWGLGFLTAVSIVLIMGTVARNVVGRRVISFGDKVLHRVPVFRLLYPSIKMLIDSFSPERRGSFKAVVLVQHPREGTWAFAFVTSELTLESPVGKGEMVTVFVPTNNLYLGDVVVVPRSDVIFTGLDRRGGPARDPLGGDRDALQPASLEGGPRNRPPPIPPTLRAPAKPWRFASAAVTYGARKWPPYAPRCAPRRKAVAPRERCSHMWGPELLAGSGFHFAGPGGEGGGESF